MSEPSSQLDHLSIGYAAYVFIEGVLGYFKAKFGSHPCVSDSIPSLVAGLGFSGLLGAGVYQVAQNPRHFLLPLLTNYALAAAMGKRFMRSSKMYPAGYITLFSSLMVLRFIVRAVMNAF